MAYNYLSVSSRRSLPLNLNPSGKIEVSIDSVYMLATIL